MANMIIIGAGPAGVSAALYTARANIETTILHNGGGALTRTGRIENYYGFAQPISGRELLEQGMAGAKRLGVRFLEEEVVGLTYGSKLTVQTSVGEHEADAVILATGTSRLAPNLPGLQEFEGRGVSYCAVCDAFFYRGKDVAVLGSGEYALHEARDLQSVARSVTILTNGESPAAAFPPEFTLRTEPLAAVEGRDLVSSVRFQSGDTLPVDGLFIAVGVAGSTALARKIGAITMGSSIAVDENMATNIPGLYAAGDCTGGLLQIAKAVCDGAKAGIEAIKFVRSGRR